MSVRNTFPQQRPTLNLDFANSKTLDPRITFTRTSTATYVDEDGLIKSVDADVARFDHDPETGECLGLLVEESRSNLVTYSSDMSQWSANVSPIYADNDTTAPDGTLTADKLTGNNAAADGRFIIVTISANTTYSVASFIKPTDQPRTRIGVYSNVDSWYGNVDTDWDANGEPTTQNSVGASNIKYEPYPNGWYRVSFQFTSPATINGNVNYFHMPDRTISGKSAWFWGAQLEAGAFPTSYIPRDASTATRNPDNVSITGDNFSDWYNQSEGTFYSQFKGESRAGSTGYVTKIVYSISDGSFNNSHYGVTPESNGDMYWYSVSSGAGQGLLGITPLQPFASNVVYKSAYAIKTNDRALSINGYIDTDSTTTLPVVNRLYIGSSWTGSSIYLGGHISKLTYYPTRLTNAQLQTLTK
jgi:hypothetical protein